MYILYQCNREENDSEIIIPMVCSKDRSLLVRYLDDLLKESKEYDIIQNQHEEQCKAIIKEYLQKNLDAIIGWNDVRSRVSTSFPITQVERERIINFLVNNYRYSYGENIVNNQYSQSFIPQYCENSKLTKPYPVLPAAPKVPSPYLTRELFRIDEIKSLDI